MWAARWFWEQRLTSSDLRPLRMPSPTTWPVITNPTSAPANAPPATYSSNTYSPNSQVLPALWFCGNCYMLEGFNWRERVSHISWYFMQKMGIGCLLYMLVNKAAVFRTHTHSHRLEQLHFFSDHFLPPLQNLHCARAQLIHQNVWRHHCTALGE